MSYRREDAAHAAGRLHEKLSDELPEVQIFLDVDALEPGVDFVKELTEQVSSSDVMLAIIGKAWLSASDTDGNLRLKNRSDYVRIEIEAALDRGIRLIPVLVDGAQPLNIDLLPPELQPLARLHAVEITHVRFNSDTELLAQSLKRFLASRPTLEALSTTQTTTVRKVVHPNRRNEAPPPPIMSAPLRKSWWLFMVHGGFAILFSLFTFILSEVVIGYSAYSTSLLYGAYVFVDGALAISAAMVGRDSAGPQWWLVIVGTLGVAIGMLPYLMTLPILPGYPGLYIFAGWAISTGALKIVAGIRLREIIENERMLISSGVLSILLGAILIIIPYAVPQHWVIGTYAILAGVISTALAVRLMGTSAESNLKQP